MSLQETAKNQDYISYHEESNNLMIQIFYIREGKCLVQTIFILRCEQDTKEKVASFIKQFYLNTNFIPDEILVEEDFEDREVMEKFLSEKRGRKLNFIFPFVEKKENFWIW